MSASAKPRRRTKPSIAVRVRTFWVIAVLAACLAIALGVAFVNAPQLRVRSVDADVPPNGPVTKSAAIATALNHEAALLADMRVALPVTDVEGVLEPLRPGVHVVKTILRKPSNTANDHNSISFF